MIVCFLFNSINNENRDASKPVRSFCAFTSTPSQLRWNPLSAHILASAHDGEVRIWDTRKTDTYVAFITAHFSSISSLDWSPKKSEQLVTCAQDSQIKIWDINFPLEFKIKSMTAKPVWKIRYTVCAIIFLMNTQLIFLSIAIRRRINYS
jgi:WD40 repeat protein